MRAPRHSNLSTCEPCLRVSSSRLITFFKDNPPLAPGERFAPLWGVTGGRQEKPASSVDLSKDNILSTNNRHGIRDHVAARHLVERSEVRKARRADLEAVGLVRAVRDEIDAELTFGR